MPSGFVHLHVHSEYSLTDSTIRVGDPVRVQVDRVETARGRVDLLPVEV